MSAGPTGATMTAALFALRRLHGVRRPALTVQLAVPGREGPPSLLLDVGANAEVRPGDLVQFAYLGAAFSQAVLGVGRPRVALLSVGEEPKKGTQDVVEAHAALAAADGIDFVGNVEGRDLLGDGADVVVTDGFTGNVALKTMEGTAKAVAAGVRDAARSNPLATVGGILLRPALKGCAARWTRTPPAARSCSGCAAWRSSATAARGPRASPTPSGSPREGGAAGHRAHGRAAGAIWCDPRRDA